MPNRGTVMEAYRDWAVIMNDRCEFVKIRTKSILVPGESIEYSTKDIITDKNFLARNLSIAASFIICFISAALIFQHMSFNRAYAYVGLEINPSMEIAVNSRNLVVSTAAFNEEGLELVRENNYSKTPLETVLKEILVQSLEHEYLHGDNPNVIGVSLYITETNGSGDLMTKIEETIKGVLAENSIESTIFIFHIDKQTREEAVKNNVSPIRYFLWSKVKEQDVSLPFEEITLTNPRDFNNACLLSDKVAYQSSQEESSAAEVKTEESLPLVRTGEPAGVEEEKSIQQNSGPPPVDQGSQAAGMPQDTQNGKVNEAGSPYQQPAGSGQVNQTAPEDNASIDKQSGRAGSDGNGSVETGAEVTDQGSDSDNSSGSTSTGGSTSSGGSSSTGGGGTSSGGSGSTGGGGTGRSGSGGR